MNVLFSISYGYGYVSRLIAIKKEIFKAISSLQIDKFLERLGALEISVRRERSQVDPSASSTALMHLRSDCLGHQNNDPDL